MIGIRNKFVNAYIDQEKRNLETKRLMYLMMGAMPTMFKMMFPGSSSSDNV